MDGINGLLIIASAFSVFCQYIDNNHRSEISTAKEKAKKIDLDGAALHSLKKEVDDFIATDCLRMKGHVMSLFTLLIAIIISITLFNISSALDWLSYSTMSTIDSSVTGVFGIVLTWMSVSIAKKYIAMQNEKKDVARKCDDYSKQVNHIEYIINYEATTE